MMGVVAVQLLAFAALGALLGVAYVAALSVNVRLYVSRGAGWNALLIHLMRLVVIVAVFTLCARQGALALMSVVIGFQIMRTAAINRETLVLQDKS